MTHETRKLAIIDDDPNMCEFVAELAEGAGFETFALPKRDDLDLLLQCDPDIVVLDLFMPDCDGVELIRFLAENNSSSSIILMSGCEKGILQAAREVAVSKGLHVLGSLHKPFRAQELKYLLNLGMSAPPARPVTQIQVTEQELLEAVSENQLVLHYQPQVHVETGQIKGFEALVRWKHPIYDLIYPDSFLPMAEQSSLIDLVTHTVIEKALNDMEELQSANSNLTMSINVSPRNLSDVHFPEVVVGMLEARGISPSQLIIELTETAVCEDLTLFMDILTRLRMKKVQLAIDDFGTGYASFLQMTRAPFNELKIDQRFVKQLLTHKKDQTIVLASILVARKMRMSATAEGVESEEVYNILRDMGCDAAQGYWIAKPMGFSKLCDWLSDWQEHDRDFNGGTLTLDGG